MSAADSKCRNRNVASGQNCTQGFPTAKDLVVGKLGTANLGDLLTAAWDLDIDEMLRLSSVAEQLLSFVTQRCSLSFHSQFPKSIV